MTDGYTLLNANGEEPMINDGEMKLGNASGDPCCCGYECCSSYSDSSCCIPVDDFSKYKVVFSAGTYSAHWFLSFPSIPSTETHTTTFTLENDLEWTTDLTFYSVNNGDPRIICINARDGWLIGHDVTRTEQYNGGSVSTETRYISLGFKLYGDDRNVTARIGATGSRYINLPSTTKRPFIEIHPNITPYSFLYIPYNNYCYGASSGSATFNFSDSAGSYTVTTTFPAITVTSGFCCKNNTGGCISGSPDNDGACYEEDI